MGGEFMRVKAILDQVQETEDETKMIAEVSRIKAILDNSGYESESVLDGLLKKLKQKVVSMKVLEATMIGNSVSSLQKHVSEGIRQTARMLIRSWRCMVDEWMIANDNTQEEECGGSHKNPPTEVPTMKHQRPPVVPATKANKNAETPRNRKGNGQSKETVTKHDVMTKRKLIEPKLQHKKPLTMVVLEKECFPREVKKLQNPTKLIMERGHMPSASVETKKLQNPAKLIDKKSVGEKLEATKRKLREGYMEAENTKRARRTQVIEVHDVLRLGLAPKHKDSSRFSNQIRPCVGLVR
jgi:hypothetical protein